MDGQNVDGTLSQQDVEFLSHYLAPELLTRAQMEQMSKYFSETLMLQLDPFLCRDFAEKLKDYIAAFKHGEGGNNGSKSMPSEWKTARSPEIHRYLYLETSVAATKHPMAPILQLLQELLPSYAFKKWLALVTGFAPSDIISQHAIARWFRRGLDYILNNTHDKGQSQLSYTLDMTPTNSHHAYTSGACDISGEESYMPAESDAADLLFAGKTITQQQGGRTGCKIPMSWNKLSVILLCDGMQNFVKYVSHAASSDRWDIKGKVEIRS